MVGEPILRALARVLCALAILCGGGVAHARAGDAGEPVATCITRALPAMTPSALFGAPQSFDCTTPQTDWGSGDFWALSAPVSIAGTHPVMVRTASLWQDRVTLYVRYADGRIDRYATDGHAASRHLQLGAIIERMVHTRDDAPIVRLLWHVEGAANLRGILINPRIATIPQSEQSNLTLGAIYAGFAGLCIALLCYNLALWGALKHRFQLGYCAMVFGLLLYAYSSSGALAWSVPGIANNDRLRINYLLLAASASAALVFARAFFEPRVFSRRLARATDALIGALCGSAALFALLAPWQVRLLDALYGIAFLMLLPLAATIIWCAWRERSNFLWLFALAWAAPVTTAAVRVANNLHATPYNFWIDNSTIVAMTLEALLSSLAIAYRIRILSRERDEALRQELEARLLADTDPLTGLMNRRAFLREAIGRAGDQMLLLADIDHFKHVNDTLGHDGGDEVLRVFARALRCSVPEGALIARIGGEEFAIVAPVADRIDPEAILARLRAERMPFDMRVTASIGVCSGPLLTETHWKLLYRSADRALFDAKASGRDRSRAAYSIAFAA